jgi:hypothetical protein
MNISQKVNFTSVLVVLLAFCFATALASDTTVALRGSGSSTDENRRSLANERISVFRCDSDNQRLVPTISNKTEELEDGGFDIRICFQVSSRSISNNLYILKIDDFTFTKDRTNGDLAAAGPTRNIPYIIRQEAVDSGTAISTDFTEVYCEPGSEICALQTRLTGFFFLTSGAIEGKGKVMMQRGREERRELQEMDQFEDVFMEIDFTGGGRAPIPPEKRIIIIVSIILGLLLLCLCGSVLFCCLAGICCFAARDKRVEDTDEDDIEEVSVKVEWAPGMKRSKKGDEEEDMSETESLEDDQYWDDDIALSEDGNESDNNYSVEELDSEMTGAAAVPVPVPDQEIEEESPRRSKKYKSFEDEEANESFDQSVENIDTEYDMEEVVPVQDAEEQPRKSKKKKKKKKRKSQTIE